MLIGATQLLVLIGATQLLVLIGATQLLALIGATPTVSVDWCYQLSLLTQPSSVEESVVARHKDLV